MCKGFNELSYCKDLFLVVSIGFRNKSFLSMRINLREISSQFKVDSYDMLQWRAGCIFCVFLMSILYYFALV